MTDREIMQQALEALEDACGGRCNAEYNPCWQRDVAAALRERLAQPEPAPGYCQHCKQYTIEEPLGTHWEGCDEVHPECRKQEQEPAALKAQAKLLEKKA